MPSISAITTTRLTKAASASAALAGGIFIAVQIGHPDPGTFTTETDEWVARSLAKTAMTGLALAGITGIYLHQHRRVGVLGLLGYLAFATGFLAMLAVEVIAAVVLPILVDTHPGFVDDAVAAATGATIDGDIGALQILFNVAGAGYLLGGLLFGVALFRAGVLARWAAALLALGTLGTALLAVLPAAFDRPMAVPTGLALIGLGVSLWRHKSRTEAGIIDVPASEATLAPATRPA